MMRRSKRLLAATLILLQCSAAGSAAPAGFPPVPTAPVGAPNILMIMTDDVGFAASSTFGGAIPTPTFDRIAANGLRYNNFHTTALCSPTRAALLTGRNHHAVGFGSVADLARGEPGYTSVIPKAAGTIGQILSAAGYDTAMFGKNHNVPTWQSGPLGPFDQWGNGLGFGYFYGFNGGLTDQFRPALIENQKAIEPPVQAGYILDRDLADHAIGWLREQRVQKAGRPFLLYYAPGTAHAPIQAPAEWIARFRGKFDAGWDVYRAETLARQKRMGIVPADAKLAPLPPTVKPWNSLSPDEKKVHARFMEAYAAALAYCDDQIGRIVEDLRQSGQLDNTLIVFIQGDNGSSGEGGEHGSLNYAARVSARPTPAEELAHALGHIDAIGGPDSYPVGPVGWAVAMDTPFPFYKTVASRLGGIRNGMAISWPARLKDRGVRSQFVDVTDVAPTILEAAGVTPPASLNGAVQMPFDGVSFAYSFAQPHAPSRHRTQYFEIFGYAGIYHDGWFAGSQVLDNPALGAAQTVPDAPWQLYDLTSDFSQTTDIAAQHPAKLAEMRALFQSEAERNHVLPMLSSNGPVMNPLTRPEVTAQPGRYTFYPSAERYSEGSFPSINNRSWSIDADIDVPATGGDGVLVTQGGRFSGWGLVVLGGVPTFLYRATDRDAALFRLAAPGALATGHHHLTLGFTIDGPGIARGGGYAMQVDGRTVATAHVEHTVPFKFAPEDASIGHDTGTAVSDDYRPPFAYRGNLRSLTIELGPIQPRQAAAAAAQPRMSD